MTRSKGRILARSAVVRPSMRAVTASTAARPMAKRGWRTVVSAGDPTAAKSMSSKPTTDISPGTDTPASEKAWMAPIAISSLAAKIAVGRCGQDRMSAAAA